MSGDIEEFLRRAAEKRRKANQGQGSPQPETPKPRRLQQSPPRQSAPELPVEIIEIREENFVEPLGADDPYARKNQPYEPKSVKANSDLVSKLVSSDDIASHAEGLGTDMISHRDDAQKMVQEHLGEDVPTREFEKEKESKFANHIVKLLSSPQSISQAIMVKEILDRPDFCRFDDSF